MKIAHINSGHRGPATYCLNMYKYFERYDDITSLIVSETRWKKQRVPGIFEPKSMTLGGVLPVALRKSEVYSKLIDFNPDIIHHHHPSGTLDFHIIKLQSRLHSPLVVTVHVSVGSKKYFVDRVMHIFFKLVKRNFKNATVLVAISQYVKQQLIYMNIVPKDRIVLLYAGVDPKIYKPCAKESDQILTVLFVGQVRLEKGVDKLIQSVIEVSRHRKIRLNIIGSGNAEAWLRRKTKGIKFINWIGFIPNQENVAEYYAAADIVVLPTRWDEAFSYIPIEAFSAGTPIIASRAGGTPEIVEHGKTGYLFDVGHFDQLTKILVDVEHDNLIEMGLRAREYTLKNHTLDLFGEKYKCLYENVLTNPDVIKQID